MEDAILESIRSLPERVGPPPDTGPAMPHQQLTQNAPSEMQEALFARASGLFGVRVGPSGVSVPGARAFILDESLANGPPEAFMVGTEFAHLHGAADGSLHVTLPPAVAAEAVERGWAEPHPLARLGVAPSTLVMLYGPRDEAELETVWRLVETSYAFARGATQPPSAGA
jgi:Family of unknown function (DUF5519)